MFLEPEILFSFSFRYPLDFLDVVSYHPASNFPYSYLDFRKPWPPGSFTLIPAYSIPFRNSNSKRHDGCSPSGQPFRSFSPSWIHISEKVKKALNFSPHSSEPSIASYSLWTFIFFLFAITAKFFFLSFDHTSLVNKSNLDFATWYWACKKFGRDSWTGKEKVELGGIISCYRVRKMGNGKNSEGLEM